MLNQTNVPAIQRGVYIIRELSEDERTREMARRREIALRDENSAIHNAERRGRAEGIAEGRKAGKAEGIAEGRKAGKAEGKAEERAGIIAQMKASGMTDEQIEKILSVEV